MISSKLKCWRSIIEVNYRAFKRTRWKARIERLIPDSAARVPESRFPLDSTIRKLKANKFLGKDGLWAKLFKYCLTFFTICLQKLYSLLEEPCNWNKAVLLSITKKDDGTRCDSYRRISLLDIFVKILLLFSSKILFISIDSWQCVRCLDKDIFKPEFMLTKRQERLWIIISSTIYCYVFFHLTKSKIR